MNFLKAKVLTPYGSFDYECTDWQIKGPLLALENKALNRSHYFQNWHSFSIEGEYNVDDLQKNPNPHPEQAPNCS